MLKRQSTIYAQMSHETDNTSLLDHRILVGLVTQKIEKPCKEDLNALPDGKDFFDAESQRVQDSMYVIALLTPELPANKFDCSIDELIGKCDNMSTRLEVRASEAPDVAKDFLSSVLSFATTESGDSESESVSSINDSGKACTISKRSGLQFIDNEDMPTEVDISQSCDIERSNLRKKVIKNSGRQKHTSISVSRSKVNKRATATRQSVSSREGLKDGIGTDDWTESSICSIVQER